MKLARHRAYHTLKGKSVFIGSPIVGAVCKPQFLAIGRQARYLMDTMAFRTRLIVRKHRLKYHFDTDHDKRN
jgi:hypothetical protein